MFPFNRLIIGGALIAFVFTASTAQGAKPFHERSIAENAELGIYGGGALERQQGGRGR